MKPLLLAAAILTSLLATAADEHSHLPPGGRRALHGMVLFGSGPYFLEHIPMLTPPHDFQIVAKVTLRNKSGAAISREFSDQSYTLKPDAPFSLNDYVTGKLKTFNGSIHQGSFEQGGPVVKGLETVSVEVTEYLVRRQLPANSDQQWFEFDDGKNTFESNVIRPQMNQQLIRKKSGEVLWCVVGPDFFDPCP